MSPKLFNAYADEIYKHRFFKKAGFKVHGEKISDISYADDKVLLAGTPQQLQLLVKQLNIESQNTGCGLMWKRQKSCE